MQSISRDFRTTGDRLQNRGWREGGKPGKYRLSGEGLNRTKLGLKRGLDRRDFPDLRWS
ncbi:hypothetical protein THTE_0097 [Thermogutta terrifontis]|uniref:Uncharacterized protein n=1 Tax=Thermogutta terrifontis TaxID=1331910 RepID=A0A286R9Q7_9BACT|nr:hypothetical protein THTE_0097 [Thermogutta terrifontis]